MSKSGILTPNIVTQRDLGCEEIFRFYSADEHGRTTAQFSGEVILLSRVAVFNIEDRARRRRASTVVEIAPELQSLARSSQIGERIRVSEEVISSTVGDYLAGELSYSEAAFAAFETIVSNSDELAGLRRIAVEAR